MGHSEYFATLLSSALRRPEKLSLQRFRLYRVPVELCLVRPVLVDSWINIVAERSIQIVVPGPLLQLNIQFELLHPLIKPLGLLVSLRRTLLQYRELLLFLVQSTLPSLRRRPLMVAPNRCLQVRNPGMIQLDEPRVVRFESIMSTQVGLHRLSSMMCSEDLGRKTPGRPAEKLVNVSGGNAVEDEILRLLVCHKLLEVPSDWTFTTI